MLKTNEIELLNKLKEKYHDDEFDEIVYSIEKQIEKGLLSEKWVIAYNEYCKVCVPCTDDFSYAELGDKFLELAK